MNFCVTSSLLSCILNLQNEKIQSASPVFIRTAQLQDIKGIAEVLTDCFYPPQSIWSWIRPLFKLGIYEDLRSRLRSENPHYRCFVASQKIITAGGGEREQIIGTVEIGLRSGVQYSQQIPYISNLAVSPNCRRQGIAQKLLIKCDQVAMEWGLHELSLHVLDNNQPAQKLYFKHGYHLHQIDNCLSSWLFNRPKRLLLIKKTT